VDDFGQRSGIRVTFSVGAGLPTALPPRQQIEVMRVAQEALTNVRKHADATVVRVRADTRGRDLIVSIADNGRGFDPNAPGEGLGLQGMEERARLLGGMFRITSEPQGGTTVELTVPMLIPDWLTAVTGSAAETAAEVAEAGLDAVGAVTGEPTGVVGVPAAIRPPDAPAPQATSIDATRPTP
jgi:signal transduction histidine kinase